MKVELNFDAKVKDGDIEFIFIPTMAYYTTRLYSQITRTLGIGWLFFFIELTFIIDDK